MQKQKTRQHRSHMSLMDRCLTRLIEGTACKKTYHTKVSCVGTLYSLAYAGFSKGKGQEI